MAIIDYFEKFLTGKESPADKHFVITPNDSVDLAILPRALRIGTAGDVVVTDIDGDDVTYTCVAGELLLFRAVRIKATGTTATGIIGWY